MIPDRELLEFAARILERNGGAVEQSARHVDALLPAALAEKLELPEEVSIGEHGTLLTYGAPLLDRLFQHATTTIPVTCIGVKIPYLKKAGFDRLIEESLSLGRVQYRPAGHTEERQPYMVLVAHYVAVSDEQKEGLVETAFQEQSGAIVLEVISRWKNYQPVYYSPKEIPDEFLPIPEASIRTAMDQIRSLVHNELIDYYDRVRRHLRRDIRNTREYYQALQQEMEASLLRYNLSASQIQERKLKIEQLAGEMSRQIEELQGKYRTRVTITAKAALRILIPVVRLTLEVRCKKLTRDLPVFFNPLSHSLDPLVCEHCRRSTRSVRPRAQGDRLCFFCPDCAEG